MHGSKRTYRTFKFDNTFAWKSAFAETLSVPGNPSVAVGNPPVFKGTPDVWSLEDFLTDAVEVLAGKGTLHCRVHRSRARGRSGVRILIADDGPGIAPEHRKKVFEPLFTTKGQNGADLGLWMAKVLVQKNAGPLRVRTGPQGRQTCFVGLLPVPGPVLPAELDQITLNSLAQQLNRTQITLLPREGQLDCAQNPSPDSLRGGTSTSVGQ
jgi:hypothetical protein